MSARLLVLVKAPVLGAAKDMYKNNQYQLAVIFNAKKLHEIGRLLNGAIHAVIGTALNSASQLKMLDYDQGGDDFPSASISTYPVICLKGKNSNQLKRAVEAASEAEGVVLNYFTDAFLAGSAEAQMRQTRETPVEDQEFVAVVLFGSSETVKPLTKRFSLVQNITPANQPG